MKVSPVELAGWLAMAVAAGAAQEHSAEGKLVLKIDVAASLVVDGQRIGGVAAGETRVLSLPHGPHTVAVVSDGGEVKWEERIDIQATQSARMVDLARKQAEVRQDYVKIPGGTFEMGCAPRDTKCADDEKPRHKVTLSRDFWMMRTEVTTDAWRKKSGKPMPPTEPRFNREWKWETYPIVNVTWADAAGYCETVGGRLPTEAEWEYAARGGQDGWLYVWGNQVKPVLKKYMQANVADQRSKGAFDEEEGPRFPDYDDGYSYTAPTFQYSPNDFGLFDMGGNVWEWSADLYGERSYESPATDPKGPDSGESRVVRSGSWKTGVGGMRISNRFSKPPDYVGDDLGIRCARDVMVP